MAMAARIAGLYDMEDTLGSGHFAVVKSARHVFTGKSASSETKDHTIIELKIHWKTDLYIINDALLFFSPSLLARAEGSHQGDRETEAG